MIAPLAFSNHPVRWREEVPSSSQTGVGEQVRHGGVRHRLTRPAREGRQTPFPRRGTGTEGTDVTLAAPGGAAGRGTPRPYRAANDAPTVSDHCRRSPLQRSPFSV